MLDREFLIDAAACGAAHVESSVEIVPLIDDNASETFGIVGARQSSVLEIADKPAVAGYR